jgi:hypoxanthine phosphoribosyltransferase
MSIEHRKHFGPMGNDIQDIVISSEQIQGKISALGLAISRDYLGLNPLMVGVLKGVLFFMADLLRQITIPVEIDFIAVSSYSVEARDQGYVRVIKDLESPIHRRHIIFVEDVIDTGLTLNYILQNLRARQPSSIEVCTLFNKPEHRLIEIPIRYKGFDLPDEFVVGYGLDFKEKYRNLPYVGSLKPSVFHAPRLK